MDISEEFEKIMRTINDIMQQYENEMDNLNLSDVLLGLILQLRILEMEVNNRII